MFIVNWIIAQLFTLVNNFLMFYVNYFLTTINLVHFISAKQKRQEP